MQRTRALPLHPWRLNPSLQLQIELLHIFFFLVGVPAQGVHNLSVVPQAAFHVFRGAHHGDVQLAATGAHMIPVDEIDMGKLAAIQYAVLDGQGSLRPKNTLRRCPSVFMLV